MANKGVLAVEASLKLLRSGADFRLKNKSGQEVLELLEKNENLSTKQMDQVMCDIWARMDSEEQSQELKSFVLEQCPHNMLWHRMCEDFEEDDELFFKYCRVMKAESSGGTSSPPLQPNGQTVVTWKAHRYRYLSRQLSEVKVTEVGSLLNEYKYLCSTTEKLLKERNEMLKRIQELEGEK